MTMKIWIGNYDGRREGLIIAKTKTAAARVAQCSLRAFNNYWSEASRVVQHSGGAMEFKHETLYTRPNNVYGSMFIEGRCPL